MNERFIDPHEFFGSTKQPPALMTLSSDLMKVYLLEGSPVSQSDLENAGVRTAKAVLVMKDPR